MTASDTQTGRGRRRYLEGVVCVSLAVAAALWATYVADRTAPWDSTCYTENACDSLTFSAVAELLDDGRSPYESHVRSLHISTTRLAGEPVPFDLPFQYPPNALPLFALRSLSSPRVVSLSMVFLTAFTCLLLFWRLAAERLTEPGMTILLTCSIAFSGIVGLDARFGQTGLLAATLVLGTLLGWKRKPLSAGILLGILAFKPQYALPILIVAIVHREWRIVVGAAGGFAVLTGLSAVLFGVDEWFWFLRAVMEPNHTLPRMTNWIGLASRAAPGAHTLIQHAALPVYLVAVAGLAAWLRTMGGRTTIEEQLSVVTVWMLLASPNSHAYDLLVIAPALIFLSRKTWGVGVGPLFLLLSWATLPYPSRWLMILAVAGLALLCSHFLSRDANPAPLKTNVRLPATANAS